MVSFSLGSRWSSRGDAMFQTDYFVFAGPAAGTRSWVKTRDGSREATAGLADREVTSPAYEVLHCQSQGVDTTLFPQRVRKIAADTEQVCAPLFPMTSPQESGSPLFVCQERLRNKRTHRMIRPSEAQTTLARINTFTVKTHLGVSWKGTPRGDVFALVRGGEVLGGILHPSHHRVNPSFLWIRLQPARSLSFSSHLARSFSL